MNGFIREELYKQILQCMPIPCVDIAIIVQGAVLLVKRRDFPAKDQWWLPGGRVLKGEMMRETAIRKAREEVGLECHAGPIIYTAETVFPDGPFEIPIHSINSCFFMYPKNPDAGPRLNGHHTEFKWVKVIPPGVHPYVARCLAAAGLQ